MRQMHQLPYCYPIDPKIKKAHQNMIRYPTVSLQLMSCLVQFDSCVVQSYFLQVIELLRRSEYKFSNNFHQSRAQKV